MREHTGLVPRVMVLITGSAKAKKAEEILREAGLPVNYRFQAAGTATGEVLDYLGLADNEKTVFLSILHRQGMARLMPLMSAKLDLDKPGGGILFTLPLNGISNPAMQLLDEKVRRELIAKAESEVAEMAEKAEYSLVLAITNRGCSEAVMETARTAGAKGGTVINARRLGMEDTLKLWGITLQDEREIIAIVAARQSKGGIMRAIGEKYGMGSEAQGLVLSIPVEELAGMA